jgi:KaiC/GvpD/RAD55 family RecA-like ATPase
LLASQGDLTFSKFGKSFQESLVQLVVEQRVFADQIEEVLDIEFLEFKYLRALVKKIFEYKQKYKTHPSYPNLVTIFKTEFDDESDILKKQIKDYIIRINKSDVDGEEYIKDTALDFCRKQKLKEAMVRSIGLLQQSSFDEISSVINNALKLGADSEQGYEWIKDFEERFLVRARNPIATGWDEIDRISKQGLGKGELGVVIAPTGAGKSMVLTHIGSHAIQQDLNVVHYTLELLDTVVAGRYDSCITGIELNDLMDKKEEIYEKIKDIDGTLVIKEYPTKTATVKTLKNHLEKIVKKGDKIDMIIVDYADLLKPTSNYREKRTELESIYEELRTLAYEFSCPVWTASQTNRSGLDAEVITMNAISEAFSKCFVADFIFSVSRTIMDKAKNSGRIFIAKNRNGPDGIVFPIFMDTSCVKIDVLPRQAITTDNSPNTNKNMLREKYVKYMTNKNGSNVT